MALVFMASLFFVGALIQPVQAAHRSDSSVIMPVYKACGQLQQYELIVNHTGDPVTQGDPIYNVRIFNNSAGNARIVDGIPGPFLDQNGFTCGSIPGTEIPLGWVFKGFYVFGSQSYCEYETVRDPSNTATIDDGETGRFTFWINITQESIHRFQVSTIDTKDPVGDIVYSYPNITVDCTPPVTTKSFDGPQKFADGKEWIDGVTKIRLAAIDPPPHPSGVDKTYYRVTAAGDYACGSSSCIDVAGSGDFLEYTGPIGDIPESCHMIEFYSIDKVGNTEGVKRNCFFVDRTPPVLTKNNGNAIPAEDQNPPINGVFHWLTSDMPITFSCVDQEPHPAEGEQVCFKVSYDVPQWPTDVTQSYCASYGGQMQDTGYCCVNVNQDKNFVFNFKQGEDSVHSLDYYCRDAVNKRTGVETQYYRVDNTPPTIMKDMFGSYLGDCPSGTDLDHGDCYVADNGQSGVAVSFVDGGQVCAVDDVSCEYVVWWLTTPEICDQAHGRWDQVRGQCQIDSGAFNDSPHNIIFSHDSTHILQLWCADRLGNQFYDEETFLVDSTPPVTIKSYGDPHYPAVIDHNAPHWITSQTPITLDEFDSKVGVRETKYRVTLLNSDAPCNYIDGACGRAEGSGEWKTEINQAPFTIPESSCHLIEYYSIDKLGNTESVKRQCVFVDNEKPLTNKTVGDPKIWKMYDDGGQCGGEGRTYTLDGDFDLGTLSGLQHTTVHDQLQLVLDQASTFPIMWIANSGEDTVSKWDTNTNKEIARYHTWFGPKANHGAWSGPAPSRTAVDAEGNVYVANRHFDGKPADVFKILANDWIDRNGNGIMDTSVDANSNGVIEAGEMLQMTDSNSNGIIDPSEIKDERIAWVARVGTNNCLGRSVAIDLNGNIWLGCYSERTYYKLDGVDGEVIGGPYSVGSHSPYGALVDKYGTLWGASLSNNLLRLNTNDPSNYSVITHSGSNYGIAIGYNAGGYTQVYLGADNPYYQYNSETKTFGMPGAISFSSLGIAVDKDGNIVVGNSGTGGVAKFAPNGALIWNAGAQVTSEARGTVVDSNNDVWIIHVNANKISKFNGTNGAPLGVFNSGLHPYTYSDATGLGLKASVSAGTWNVISDGGVPDADQGPVSWHALVPDGTTFEVKVRSSNDHVAWSPWEVVGNGVPFATTPNGRYLEVQVFMKSATQNSPVLYDLTIGGVCEGPKYAWYITQQTPITFTCNDAQPHPVDDVTIHWRSRWANDCADLDGAGWTDWTHTNDNGARTYFGQDSCHQLEYYCTDALGNEETHQFEIDVVDTKAPEITTAIEGPWAGVCSDAPQLPIGLRTEIVQTPCFIDGVTNITVNAVDPQPHPVDNVTCSWSYTVDGGDPIPGERGLGTSFKVHFPEESHHVLTIVCRDALGNSNTITRTYDVDKTPPVTTKTYGEPFYSDRSGEWVTSQTPITLTVEDAGPHKSGIKETNYRVTLVDDKYCYNEEKGDDFLCDAATGSGEWTRYTTPFTAGGTSCHLIEYYSVDNVDKRETVKKQCVFVDNEPPVPLKTVGVPSTKLQNGDYTWIYYPYVNGKCWIDDETSIDCWKVTTMTPVTMDCTDAQPHPVDHNKLYFKVDFDGSDLTAQYCTQVSGQMQNNGWCLSPGAPTTISFKEESEHNLKYYCVDALGNSNEQLVDDEKFKVEGSSFTIHLNKKWNLISVPFVLQDNVMKDLFDPLSGSVKSVWSFDGTAWHVYTPDGVANDDLTTMVPGEGYWVLNTAPADLIIGGSLFSPGKTPPAKNIVRGWNLIGYYGNELYNGSKIFSYNGPTAVPHPVGQGKASTCALGTLVDTTMGHPEWSSLWTYWEPYNTDGNPATELWIPLNFNDRMDAGSGYWLEIDKAESYSPSTTCPLIVS